MQTQRNRFQIRRGWLAAEHNMKRSSLPQLWGLGLRQRPLLQNRYSKRHSPYHSLKISSPIPLPLTPTTVNHNSPKLLHIFNFDFEQSIIFIITLPSCQGTTNISVMKSFNLASKPSVINAHRHDYLKILYKLNMIKLYNLYWNFLPLEGDDIRNFCGEVIDFKKKCNMSVQSYKYVNL